MRQFEPRTLGLLSFISVKTSCGIIFEDGISHHREHSRLCLLVKSRKLNAGIINVFYDIVTQVQSRRRTSNKCETLREKCLAPHENMISFLGRN